MNEINNGFNTGFDNELTEEGKAIAKRIDESKEPLKNINAYYEQARIEEEEKRKQAEAEELASLPPKPPTQEQQMATLTDAITNLTKQLEAMKGQGE